MARYGRPWANLDPIPNDVNITIASANQLAMISKIRQLRELADLEYSRVQNEYTALLDEHLYQVLYDLSEIIARQKK